MLRASQRRDILVSLQLFSWFAGSFRSITGSRTGGPMANVNDALAANRDAVLDLVAAAERSAATWTTPRAPGKWSPSQVVEHVARSLEGSAKLFSGGDP